MYTTLDIAYNDNSSELDKMAREINNKKTNLFKSVHNDFQNKQKKWENDIVEYNNSYKNPYGYFNLNPNSDKIDKIYKKKSKDSSYESDSESDSDSLSSIKAAFEPNNVYV